MIHVILVFDRCAHAVIVIDLDHAVIAFIAHIAFGTAEIVDDEKNLRRIAGLIGDKFSHDYPADCRKETDEVIAAGKMLCVEITVEHLTGKCGREELKKRGVLNNG